MQWAFVIQTDRGRKITKRRDMYVGVEFGFMQAQASMYIYLYMCIHTYIYTCIYVY